MSKEVDLCPICLEPFDRANPSMNMPSCNHALHVRCALSAAQYDVRCPICRCKNPLIIDKNDMYASNDPLEAIAATSINIAELYDEHELLHRRYQRKRASCIRRHDSLRK